MDATLLKAFFTLAAIVAALFVVLVIVRRYAAGQITRNSGTQFRVIGQLALQPKKQVYLLLVADRLLVVGAADQAMTTLAEITDPDTIAALVESRVAAPSLPLFRKRTNGAPDSPSTASELNTGGVPSFSEFIKSLGKKEGFLRELL
jgi:flagellar biogenesis protein FliO